MVDYFLKRKTRNLWKHLFFGKYFQQKCWKFATKNHWNLNSNKCAKFFKKKKTLLLNPIYLPTYWLIYIPCFTNLKMKLTYLPTYLPTYRNLQTPKWNLPIYLPFNKNLVDVYAIGHPIATLSKLTLKILSSLQTMGLKACTRLWTLLHICHFVTCLLVILFLCDL
jgi:hypothetical protein